MNLEIHVKDTARFPGNWAFFVSADGRAPGKLMPQTANCYSCHQDHGAVDTTFVQFYPTLFAIAQEKGTISASYLEGRRREVRVRQSGRSQPACNLARGSATARR